MSDPNPPEGMPDDLPPEYAEAYRRGFRRAYGGDQPAAPTPEAAPPTVEPPPSVEPPPEDYDQFEETLASLPGVPWNRPSHRNEDERPVWFVPAILASLALVLLVGAYLLGRAFSDSINDAGKTNQPTGAVIPNTTAPSPSHHPRTGSAHRTKPAHRRTQASGPAQPAVYQGAVHHAAISGASASCQSPNAVDGAGHPVSYGTGNLYDGDLSTAWRCNGNGVGQQVTLTLPAATRLGEVGLVPGYAKTDPVTGTDRYAQNDRITQVRWTFDDGTSVVQSFSGSPTDRSLRTIRIPVVKTSTVAIQILASTPGALDTVAISEVSLGAVAG